MLACGIYTTCSLLGNERQHSILFFFWTNFTSCLPEALSHRHYLILRWHNHYSLGAVVYRLRRYDITPSHEETALRLVGHISAQ